MAKKGYWIAHVDITDPERYKDYVAANAAPLEEIRRAVSRAQWRVPGSQGTARRPPARGDRVRQLRHRQGLHNSPEYQAAAKIRDEASTADFIIIEGYEG